MKKITSLLFVLLFVSCYEKQRDCADFRTGTFEFIQEIDGKKHTSVFTRDEKLQIETYKGVTDTASVRWVNDCELVLQKLHPKTMQEKKAVAIKILYTEGSTYTFEYSYLGEAQRYRGVATRVD